MIARILKEQVAAKNPEAKILHLMENLTPYRKNVQRTSPPQASRRVDDLHRLLDVPLSGIVLDPDIFGAIWLDSGRIVIDESLDPEERPAMEGRYRFTLAHKAADIGGCIEVSSGPIAIRSRSSRMFRSRP